MIDRPAGPIAYTNHSLRRWAPSGGSGVVIKGAEALDPLVISGIRKDLNG